MAWLQAKGLFLAKGGLEILEMRMENEQPEEVLLPPVLQPHWDGVAAARGNPGQSGCAYEYVRAS